MNANRSFVALIAVHLIGAAASTVGQPAATPRDLTLLHPTRSPNRPSVDELRPFGIRYLGLRYDMLGEVGGGISLVRPHDSDASFVVNSFEMAERINAQVMRAYLQEWEARRETIGQEIPPILNQTRIERRSGIEY